MSLDFTWPLASPHPAVLHVCLDPAEQAVLGMGRKGSRVAVLRAEGEGGKERKTGGVIQRKHPQDLTNCIRGLALCLGLYPTLTAGRTWLVSSANPLVSSMGSTQVYSLFAAVWAHCFLY